MCGLVNNCWVCQIDETSKCMEDGITFEAMF
jgi:hypothetical protein